MREGLPGTIEDLIEEYGLEEVKRRFEAAYKTHKESKEPEECPECGGGGVNDDGEECANCEGFGYLEEDEDSDD
jgi:DnaJ-class molecular chaperone